MAELKARGTAFEQYRSRQFQTVDGIATTQSGRVAWFEDSGANVP